MLAWCVPLAGLAVVPGDPAPAWQGQDLDSGALVRFPEVLNGKPAVVVFWATWCPYCKAFMPYAKSLQQEFAEHGVQIVTLNAKERGRGDPAAYVRSLNMPIIAVGSADDIAEQYNVAFIPGLFVVDGKGTVVYRRRSTNLPAGKTVAGQWADEVRAVLKELLHKQPAPNL
ncbi:MAG: TlpA family protein disulfide reductase [Pseudomonadales bacterium]